MEQPRPHIFRSSVIITTFTLLTGVVNYLTLAILALSFGAQKEMDAFFSASTIPQIILAVLMASLINTLMPFFIEIKHKDEEKAWKTVSAAANILFLFLGAIALFGFIFSDSIILLISPGFSNETSILSVSLLRILLISMVFSGVSIILTSLHYAYHRFLNPCLAQALNSLIILLFVVGLRPNLGIKSVAFGSLAGSIIQFLILIPILVKKGRYRLWLKGKDVEILRLGGLIFPLLLSSIFYKMSPLIERFFASRLGEGNIAYLGYAYKLISTLVILIAHGLSTALFPRMSEYSAKDDFGKLKETLSKAIKVLTLVTMPIVIFILLTRFDLVRWAFQRGDFTPQATQAVGNALVAYMGVFLASAIGLPIVNTLYSLLLTKKVATVGILSFIFYIFMTFHLSNFFGYLGIAYAASIHYIINIILFSLILKRKLGGWKNTGLSLCILKSALASALAFFPLYAILIFIGNLCDRSFDLAILGIPALFLYFVILKILKTEELTFILSKISPSKYSY